MTAGDPFWLAPAPLLLASGSATRRDMLLAAGIPLDTVPSGIDERVVEAPLLAQGSPPQAIAAALACAKAFAVSLAHPGRIVLGADQVLACGTEIFHKPVDATAAAAQIAALAGRTHSLHSAFVLAQDGGIIGQGLGSADLVMRDLTPGFISSYVARAGEAVLGSVGGYQIEGLGAQLFDSVVGDHFTILGLPLLAVLAALRELRLLAS